MNLHTNKRYMPIMEGDPLKDNQSLINKVKHVLLDSRGVPEGTAPWEWIQHFVDPFVNTYSTRYERILHEGWTKYDVNQCHQFLFTILSNVDEAVKEKHKDSLKPWTEFFRLVQSQK